MKLTHSQQKQIFLLLKKLGQTDDRANMLYGITGGAKTSVADLTTTEASTVIQYLKQQTPIRQEVSTRLEATRKMGSKIIYQLVRLGYTLPGGAADYDRINDFIQNIGSNNPRRVKLWALEPDEMQAVCTQVDERYKNEKNRNPELP